MGLTSEDLTQLTESYLANMAALRNATLAGTKPKIRTPLSRISPLEPCLTPLPLSSLPIAGKFSWQMLWTGGAADGIGSTGPTPIIKQTSCAAGLRQHCNASSPAQTRAMMYAFNSHDPAVLPELEQDLANFLLIRGPYAWLGHGWKGCSRSYFFPPQLDVDYGIPSGLCRETASGSGVFIRDFSYATVQMDCNHWKPTITMK